MRSACGGLAAIIGSIFLPVASAHAGRSGYALRRFLGFDLLAVTLWASYGALLGHFGGQALDEAAGPAIEGA